MIMMQDIAISSNDFLSIQSLGNLDTTSQVQSSHEADNPTVQCNILPTK